MFLFSTGLSFEVNDEFLYCNLQGNLDYVELDNMCKKLSLPEEGGQLLPIQNNNV